MSERVPVLFFAPVPDFKGGAERSLMDLIANPGVVPSLAVPAEGPLSEAARARGVPTYVVELGAVADIRRPFRPWHGLAAAGSLWRAAHALNRAAGDSGARIVHTNGLKAHAIGLAARRLGGRPTVIHVRDIANTRIERLTWGVLQSAADRMILVSRACWPGPHLPANARVVHNGFAVPDDAPPPAGGTLRIGFVGRIHPDKGLHDLVEALALARAQGARAELIVRGAFAPETPEYEGRLRRRIAALGLSDAVSFEGFVSDPAVVYAGMSTVCVPSTAPDPLPRSVMEAMGRGLPVIAASCGGIPEMIEDGRSGLLADGPEAIARSLLALESEPGRGAFIGRAARQRCLETFTLSKLHADIGAVYRELLRQVPAAAGKAP